MKVNQKLRGSWLDQCNPNVIGMQRMLLPNAGDSSCSYLRPGKDQHVYSDVSSGHFYDDWNRDYRIEQTLVRQC